MTEFRETTLGEFARRFADKFGLNEAEVLAELRRAGFPDIVRTHHVWSSASLGLGVPKPKVDREAEWSRVDAENLRGRVPPIRP